MPNYEYEQINHTEFEDLANVLCAKYITRGTNVYGAGTDGGREAAYEGKMTYPLGDNEDSWDGYLVVQCKHKAKLSESGKTNARWAIRELDKEMAMYKNAVIPRRKPEYFLYVTNVELSAKDGTGGKDAVLKRLEHWREEYGMKAVGLWDRDKLDSFLTENQDIVRAFGQLQPGALVHAAVEFFLSQNADIKQCVSLFVNSEIIDDQYVNLKEAGQKTDEQPALARVFVDLRATGTDKSGQQLTVYAADAVQRASDRQLSPHQLIQEQRLANIQALGAVELDTDDVDALFLDPEVEQEAVTQKWIDPSRFVFIGGPGQGKSTLVQYLAQRHRASLLAHGLVDTFSTKVGDAVTSIEKEAELAGCGLPNHPRLPFRIILEKFAGDLYNGEVESVMDYIAANIRTRSGQPFARQDAERLLQQMPLLVIFDGLDEVPAASNRKDLMKTIRRFFTEVTAKNADVLIIATTRPQGYGGEFDPSEYNHLTLNTFSQQEALNYAQKLVEAKYADRAGMQETVMNRLRVAAGEKAIARLMESPLQVTIMAVLVESTAKLPRDRYVLFNDYYDIIYKREQGRGGPLAEILTEYRQPIEVLHDRIGLRLQVEGETRPEGDNKTTRQSRLTEEELEAFVRAYLTKDGHRGVELDVLTEQFMRVALDRLVFIMPLQADSYGFEVRSLQEFAAARELTRVNDYTIIRERLLAIAPIPYWRNTTLFAIGRVFGQGDMYCDMLGQLCGQLNKQSSEVLSKTLAGSRLALDIFEEGIGNNRPLYRDTFLEHALRLLTLPYEPTASKLASLYEPKYEQIYEQMSHAAVGLPSASVPLALFVMLLKIIKRQTIRAEWAKTMLQQLWPRDTKDGRILLEEVAEDLTWEAWQVEAVERIARESSIGWVDGHLAGIQNKLPASLKWITDARSFLHVNRGRAALRIDRPRFNEGEVEPDNTDFEYLFGGGVFTEGALMRVAAAKPTHESWVPYIEGAEFLLNPSAYSLANAIKRIVSHSTYIPGEAYFFGMPWQLQLVINRIKTKEEAFALVESISQGKHGDTADWLKAEKRWQKKGFTAADFQVFSDEEWPFSPAIAKRGIQPLGNMQTSHVSTPDDSVGKVLLEAFETTTTSRARSGLAAASIFLRGYTEHHEARFLLPFDTVKQLVSEAQKFRSILYGTSILSFLPADFNWFKHIDELDVIGKLIDLTYNKHAPQLLSDVAITAIVNKCTLLLMDDPIKEGILRILASVLMSNHQRVESIVLPNRLNNLSEAGQAALIAINLYAQQPFISVEEIKDKTIELWDFTNGNRVSELKHIIYYALERDVLSEHVVAVVSGLLDHKKLSVGIKKRAVDALIRQTQYLNSGFGTEEYKRKLQIIA